MLRPETFALSERLVLRSRGGSRFVGLWYSEAREPGAATAGIRKHLMSGRYLAVEEVTLGRTTSSFHVKLIDVRTRRAIRVAATGTLPPERRDSGTEGIGRTTDFLLRDGTVAWIARDESATAPAWEVWTMDAAGARRLDSGPEIEPGSLALSRGHVYWTRAGAPMHAATTR